jgi:hypothetical protein
LLERLGSGIGSMTLHRHRATTNVATAAPVPTLAQ